MITLCLETATARIGVALTKDSRLIAETLLDAPGGLQNRLLMPAIERALADSMLHIEQIDLFACAVGPGSFTGVRTGIAAVQGLALALQKPCVGISTLAMLAMNCPQTTLPVYPLLDARKQEVYVGGYHVSTFPACILPDQALAPSTLLERITTPALFLGDGARRYRALIQDTLGELALFAPDTADTIRPSNGCLLAEADYATGNAISPEQLLPRYLRLSEAELSRQNNAA